MGSEGLKFYLLQFEFYFDLLLLDSLINFQELSLEVYLHKMHEGACQKAHYQVTKNFRKPGLPGYSCQRVVVRCAAIEPRGELCLLNCN